MWQSLLPCAWIAHHASPHAGAGAAAAPNSGALAEQEVFGLSTTLWTFSQRILDHNNVRPPKPPLRVHRIPDIPDDQISIWASMPWCEMLWRIPLTGVSTPLQAGQRLSQRLVLTHSMRSSATRSCRASRLLGNDMGRLPRGPKALRSVTMSMAI
ncbi:hypothetical protein VTK56DRAFT_2282 [Thermocarpiscus australiensis]